MRQLVAVVGPTASGKTAFGIQLAQALESEVISADSMQFYRGMEIGTGAPTPEEQAQVPHHLVGVLSPSEEMTAAEFGDTARELVSSLNARGKTAVVVGGSGLYLQSLIDGLFPGPSKHPAIRARLEAEAADSGIASLYARLEEVDPLYANVVYDNDLRRIVRALEVHELSGRPLSELHREYRDQAESLDAVQIGLDYPREALYDRINRRVDVMLDSGLVQEVKTLIDDGYGDDIHRLKSLGYREIAAHLRGECSLDDAAQRMKMFTRRYAKRQLTWFKGDTRVQWLPVNTAESSAFHLERALELLQT